MLRARHFAPRDTGPVNFGPRLLELHPNRNFLRLVLAAILAAAWCAPAPAQTRYYYLNPQQIDLTVLLPPPPDMGSGEALADEEQVASAVSNRTAVALSEAQEASARTVFFFARSIGPQFTAAHLPRTARFFARISSDVQNLVVSAKDYWQRPRPDGAAKKHGAYPSGHAAFAASTAIVLTQLLPAKRDAIFSQARIFAVNRILLGLHYPSDIASGWTTGTLAAFVMMHDRVFQRDYAEVNAELRRAHI
ncbi:MAG TPA: phosphatase PAP2 family protein [Candidatus Cybelea sp.]|jgi:acid phosphatase (class A)|nr:phosphatase PAP2 family protein [Candidatus Cybelea sp.]